MKIAARVVAILLLVAGIALFIEALTTTHSVWLCIPLLALSGVFTGPAIIALLALVDLYRQAAAEESTTEIKSRLVNHALALALLTERIEREKLARPQLGRSRPRRRPMTTRDQ
jgi:hypothetical protein